MRTTFLNFLESRKQFITEAFNSKQIDKALELIDSTLKKHIDGLVPLVGFMKMKQGNTELYAKQYMVVPSKGPEKSSVFQINFSQEKGKTDVYSIDFFKDMDILFVGKAKSDLTLYTMGSSIVYFLPIIWTVASSGRYNISQAEAVKIGRGQYDESYYYVGALRYTIFENASFELINKAWSLGTNDSIFNTDEMVDESEARDFKQKKMNDLKDAQAHKNDSPAAKDVWKKAVADIKDIDAAIRGGATTLGELKVAIKHNVSLVAELDKETEEVQKKFEEEHEDPDLVFKKMQKYVKMVIKGINPSVILCGAPGVGKTYNVKKQLKASDYNEGHNLCTIKGKCTPRVLYSTLFEYKNKGNIVLIDDADGLVGPGAPEDCINILKAALDSSSDDEGRLVSYGVAGKLLDDEGIPLPKKFYYNGGIIVITNYQAGALDTALRGRSFIQDINFTVEDTLARIKSLMPGIDPQSLSPKAKIKAYDYLTELANSNTDMEISIRTFGICAKIFESALDDPDFTEDEARAMIKEQMKLQAARRSKGSKGKY